MNAGASSPRCVAILMVVLYPGSLGMDESLADLTVKAYSSMCGTCGADGACSCVPGWFGADCSARGCPTATGGRPTRRTQSTASATPEPAIRETNWSAQR